MIAAVVATAAIVYALTGLIVLAPYRVEARRRRRLKADLRAVLRPDRSRR